MKDKILLVETDDEASNLGWTCLGRIEHPSGRLESAWVWRKISKFALLNDLGNGHCDFMGFIRKSRVIKKLYESKKERLEMN